jgi:neutral ceramidase
MTNLRLGITFAGVTLAALVFIQLLAVFKLDDQSPSPSLTRNFNQWRSRASEDSTDDIFMVGAGKADVTGYVHQTNLHQVSNIEP